MADSNKTEKATPQRRKKAREQGQVARSRELPGTLAIFAVAASTMLLGSSMVQHWRSFLIGSLELATEDSFSSNGALFFLSLAEVLRWTAPVLVAGFMLSLATGFAQGGFNLAPGALAPKAERLNPGSRVKQLFSLTTLTTLLKSMVPFGIILVIGVNTLRAHWSDLVRSSDIDIRSLASTVVAMAVNISWKAGLVLLAWAAVDYGLVWKKHEGDMRMSREEVKQDHKQSDGNPVIKGQIRKLQRAMRRKQSLKSVASATLVVTNPTHYAVALRYESSMAAPEVVAKGRDLLAQKIKQIARDSNVMVMENKPLAQALFKSVEVGDAIPAELYHAVAEILAIVFRTEAEMREQDERRRERNAAGVVEGKR